MGRRLVSTKDMSREDWLELRRKSIGGSDCGAILGYSSWRSALEVYADKKGIMPEKPQTEAMRLGTEMEDIIARRFMEKTGKKVRKLNYMFMHDDYDFITANIDRDVIGENAGVECKMMLPFTKYDVENGEIPTQYYCQCQHYMMVMGYDYMYIAILVIGDDFYWHKIEKNAEFIDGMLEVEIDFWENHVMKEIPPEADESESSLRALQHLYPKDNGTEVWMGNDFDILRYQELTQTIKNLEKDRDAVKARICEELGENAYGTTDRFSVSWKTQSRTTVDTKYLKENYPEAYEESLKVSESRVLRVKEK